MLLLALGLLLFVAIHALPMATTFRRDLVVRLGEGPYKLGFSLIAAVGLGLIAYGYGKLQVSPGANPQLWYPPTWTRHAAFTVMLPAMVLLVAAYVPSRLRDAVGHPMLWAIMLWAAAHLLANGDLASVVLFASLLAWAAVDLVSARRRQARGPLGAAAPTSLVNDAVVLAVGLGVYAVMLLHGHRWLIGVPLL